MDEIAFKFEVGEKVVTNFNGRNQYVTVAHRFTWRSETGRGYKTDPPIGSGDGVDENWLRKIY